MRTVIPRIVTIDANNPRTNLAVVVLALIMFCLGSCKPEQTSYSDFRDVSHEGWYATMPLRFYPEFNDTVVNKGVLDIAIRHNNNYPYRNLNIIVDIISSKGIDRREIEIDVADGYGNWKGTGFGALYQLKKNIATGIDLRELQSVIVWQAMNGCEKVEGLENIGIIITPVN